MTSPNETIARLIDFAPGMVTPFHRGDIGRLRRCH